MHHQPTSVAEAVSVLAETDAAILAGGTDFYPGLGDRPVRRPIVDVAGIRELGPIRREGAAWRIPATATWTELQRAGLPPLFDGIVAAAREVGSVQIQNAATVVGNVCNASPAADGVPCLMAMDAAVEIAGPAGTRTLAVGDFVLGSRSTALDPGEMVTALLVPDADADADRGSVGSGFLKLGARRYLVISIVSVAAVLRVADGRIADARVAVGACSAVPRRLASLEGALHDARAAPADVGERVLPEHLAPLAPIDDVRGTADYRRDAAVACIRRALAAALPEAEVVR